MSIQSFLDGLVEHISGHFDLDKQDVEKAFNSYNYAKKETVADKKPGKTETKPAPAKKAAAKGKKVAESENEAESEEEKPTTKKTSSVKKECAYSIKERTGGALKTCGKAVKNPENRIGNLYYCGTENSGHFKSALANTKKNTPPTEKKSNEKGTTANKKSKSEPLKKIIKLEEFHLKKSQSDPTIYYHVKTRIAFRGEEKEESIGILDKDGKSLVAPNDEQLEFMELYNIRYVPENKNSKIAQEIKKEFDKQKTNKKDKQEEEEDDDSPDIEEDDEGEIEEDDDEEEIEDDD